MTIFTLKIIALITMFIDHFAFLNTFDNFYLLFRCIGRISFPLFIFIITESLFYTKDRKRFLKHLLLFAFISQIPFSLYFGSSIFQLNVMFTLFLGSLMVCLFDKYRKSLKQKDMYILAIVMVLSLFINSDYGFVGSYSILFIYLAKKYTNNKKLTGCLSIVMLCMCLYGINSIYFIFACISAVLVYFYNGLLGKYKLKEFFYWAYPVHLTIFYLLKTFIL